ncbi:MAG: hypothetical protein RLY31_3187 [Bacteroidota bacterium]|jgi:isoleucyl-tRNA synthetase
MYREFKQLHLPDIDREILAFWEKEKIFEQSVAQRPAENRWVFYEGPPSANGKPGIHHVMARTIKDLFCRYQTLLGKRVERKGGWDTHGLPIELSVEKELGITKEDIGTSISMEDYNRKCRETVMRFKNEWDDITRKMGYWVDLEHPYITYDNQYIESVWWLLGQLYEKGLLYKGYTIQPYSPCAGTGLSSHELNLPGCYREVSDTSAVALFQVLRNEQSAFLFESPDEDVRIAAWTTTPWTLPSNTALTIGPHIRYCKVRTVNPYTNLPVSVILAENLVGKWFGGKNQPPVSDRTDGFAASQLDGLRYTPLLDFGNEIEPLIGLDGLPAMDAYRVITADFVTTEDGTGIVHTAPSFGADDMRAAKANGIGALTLVDRQGKFKDTVGPFSGRFVKNYTDDKDFSNVDVDIAILLKQENKALHVAKYAHNYPHCWRTDKPILYYPLDSWFIRASACRDRMYELNKTINWKPASTGEGRFSKWLENLQDWNLSRSRFWGIPLPIWRTRDGAHQIVIDSLASLDSAIQKANTALGLKQSLPEDLHRPYIDQVVLVSDSGEPMYREPDLIDVWFDSGSMPYAQWHYPMENQSVFRHHFPADFIAEGVDQTRGWFYTLHAIATMVFDQVAFRNVVSNGLVLDKEGNKMSKRLGNAVDPFDTLERYSADATRWYMISNASPWENLKFDVSGIAEVQRKFFGTLFNTYGFFALYANIDGWTTDAQAPVPPAERTELDRWILSKLHSVVTAYRDAMDDFEPTRAARVIENFVDEHLSNWYVRLSRRRFWKGDMNTDKQAAYQTLFECLVVTAQLSASLAPFFSDWLFRNLTEPVRNRTTDQPSLLHQVSVHLTDLIQPDPLLIDKALEQRMDYAQRISSLILSLRKRENIRVRQPLRKVLLPVLDERFITQVEAVKDLILAETNVKDIEYVTDTAGIISKKIKPNFKTLGKRLGKHMKAASAAIAALRQEDIAAIEQSGTFLLQLDGDSFDLLLEDFEITAEDVPGWLVATDGPLTVALDITLTDTLLAEGTARELVNRIQHIRKNSRFNVTDRIRVQVEKHPRLLPAVELFGSYIQGEVLANGLVLSDQVDGGEQVDLFDDLTVAIAVTKEG